MPSLSIPWQICAPAAWCASRRRLAARARDDRGSRPPGPCPTSSQTTALIVYFDTSALVKLIFDEPGSELAVELWDRADLLLSSQLVYPESRAALAAAARGDRIGESAHVSAVATLEDLYAQLRTVAIDESLARHAGDLAAQHAMRGYDAVHLACALQLHGEHILLATWDNALNAAARATGRLLTNDTA
jgi:predicted nucleic acid-binding protein